MTDLLASSKALLELDADNALVPHGLGGHGRGCLMWCVGEIERLRKTNECLAGALEWKDKMIQAAVQELNEGDAGHAVRTRSWLAEALVGPPSHALSGEPTP
jgi:hypothetical protein